MRRIRNITSICILSILILTTISILSPRMASVYGQPSDDTTQPLPATVKTDNESTEIQININQDLVSSTPTKFFVEFRHPFSSMPLQHVNYNIEVSDSSGNPIYSEDNLHTHIGQNEHEITFNSAGEHNIKIDVLGIGIDPPFDTTRSGIAIVPLTVK
jgi:hypothetical protein